MVAVLDSRVCIYIAMYGNRRSAASKIFMYTGEAYVANELFVKFLIPKGFAKIRGTNFVIPAPVAEDATEVLGRPGRAQRILAL